MDPVECLLCAGKGVWFFGQRTCPDCEGTGLVPPEKYHQQIVRRNQGKGILGDIKRDTDTRN